MYRYKYITNYDSLITIVIINYLTSSSLCQTYHFIDKFHLLIIFQFQHISEIVNGLKQRSKQSTGKLLFSYDNGGRYFTCGLQSDGPTLQEGPLPDSYSNALPVLVSLPYYLYCYLNFQLNKGSKVQVSFINLLLIWPLFISLPGFLNRYQTFYIPTWLFIHVLLLVF